MNLKQRWREFRAWQREPIRYSDEGQAPRHCVNCDKEYTGNYCPRCGQKAGMGRVNWSTVKSGVMLIWGHLLWARVHPRDLRHSEGRYAHKGRQRLRHAVRRYAFR